MRLTLLVLLSLVLAAQADRTDPALAFLENRVREDPRDFIAQNSLATRYLDLLQTTGDNTFLAKARLAAEVSVASGLPELNRGGLATLARAQVALHQFALARETATKLCALEPGRSESLGLLGNILLELGDYSEATDAFAKMAKADPEGIDTHIRMSGLARVRGELDDARKEMEKALVGIKSLNRQAQSSVAWCEVQLGELEFGQGALESARKHYDAALTALPDYWAALEHIAELRANQQQYSEAITLYEKLISRINRPELCQALGDLYGFMGKAAEAKPWHERAATLYRQATEQGNTIYDHHLAGFYSDSVENPAEAIKWARKDLETRHSVYAHDAMAWALYRNGQFGDAADEMKKALALGTKDAHLFFHASMIATANGDLGRGKELLDRAAKVNPHYNGFHVHR